MLAISFGIAACYTLGRSEALFARGAKYTKGEVQNMNRILFDIADPPMPETSGLAVIAVIIIAAMVLFFVAASVVVLVILLKKKKNRAQAAAAMGQGLGQAQAPAETGNPGN